MKILIEGEKVQDVGYRAFVTEKALKLRPYIKGFDIDNITTEYGQPGVEVLIDAPLKRVQEFYRELDTNRPTDAVVSKVEPPQPHKGYLLPIEKFIAFKFPVYTAGQIYKFVQGATGVEKLLGIQGEALKSMATTLKANTDSLVALVNEIRGIGQGVRSVGDGIQELLKRVPPRP